MFTSDITLQISYADIVKYGQRSHRMKTKSCEVLTFVESITKKRNTCPIAIDYNQQICFCFSLKVCKQTANIHQHRNKKMVYVVRFSLAPALPFSLLHANVTKQKFIMRLK